MGSNLTIESPNFEKIEKESGQFTSDAIALLWAALNDTRKTQRIDARLAKDLIAPKVLEMGPSTSVDNLDLADSSVVEFTGASSVNFTGMRAPETGKTRVVIVFVSGSGTITTKHQATSETANQLSNRSGADVALATGEGIIYAYLNDKWREIGYA